MDNDQSERPQIIYVAHRLFAFHDRMLAAELASLIFDEIEGSKLFLPYCDTQEDSVVVEKKGFYLFTNDLHRLKNLKLLIAILHGPSFDDGVCMEIGFAFALGIPLILLTTDFLEYSFNSDEKKYYFPDPILQMMNPSIIRVTQPTNEADALREKPYDTFLQRNRLALNTAFEEVKSLTIKTITELTLTSQEPRANETNLIYVEPSPYYKDAQLERLVSQVHNRGWKIYVAQRFFAKSDVDLAASIDLQHAVQSRIMILDLNGPETPIGSSVCVGIGLATDKVIFSYYAGNVQTHAHGREPNSRNLMILYGSTKVYSDLDEIYHSILSIIDES